MTQPARREVPPAFTRGILDENERAALQSAPPMPDPEWAPGTIGLAPRLVSVRVLRDAFALILVVVGMVVGDAVAWVAGGWTAGCSVLAVDLIGLGLILGASSNE